MMRTSKQYRFYALTVLKHKWLSAATAVLLFAAVAGFCYFLWEDSYVYLIISLLFILPLNWGYRIFFLRNLREDNMDFRYLISGFNGSNEYFRIMGTMLLVVVYEYLWTLLFIVPGLIKSYAYAMTPYILFDDQEMDYNSAIEKSMAMMHGHKKSLFFLDLSFAGWYLLGLLTGGIGFLWIYPYHYSARAAFYEDLKSDAFI